MRRLVLIWALVLGALAFAAPVAAITHGSADGSLHPNVGGLVASQAYSDGTWIYCSGTLMSPTVFVTAAHCGDEGESVHVTFSTAYTYGDTVYSGTFHADPHYNQRQANPHDLAVVVLDSPVNTITPAQLPSAGSAANLAKKQRFTAVGYGAYEVTNQPGGHHYLYNDVRMYATDALTTVNKSWLRLSMNPARGNGGTCYGDSGGPNFVGTSDVNAAITITGDAVCRSTNVVYRLDTASARDFLGAYLTLP
jgi:secreted trypsin-like serine protease